MTKRPPVLDDDLDNLLCCATRYALTTSMTAEHWVQSRTARLVTRQSRWLSERAVGVLRRDIEGRWMGCTIEDDDWRAALVAIEDRVAARRRRPQLSDPELDDLLLSCTYYAVGRATYITSWTAGLLRAHAPWLDPTVRDTITSHIRSAVAAGRSGWDCDTEAWQQALVALTAAAEVSR